MRLSPLSLALAAALVLAVPVVANAEDATVADQTATGVEPARADEPDRETAEAEGAAAAADAETADAAAADTETADAEDTAPFLSRSLLLAPERAGDFELVDLHDYPGRPEMGYGVRYRHPDYPEILLDIFIYPIGRYPRDQTLGQLVEAMRGELREVEASGRYEHLEFGEPADIDLQRVDSDGSLLPPREGLIGREPKLELRTEGAADDVLFVEASDRTEAHMRALLDPDIGRRLPMRLRRGGEEAQSVSFLFYRQLFAFKARVSASMALSADNFDRLSNHAMATIVPRLVLRNEGSCGNQTVEMNPDLPGQASAVQLMAGLTAAKVRGEMEGCAPTLDEAIPAGHLGQLLDVAAIGRD